ncbi:MAG: C39 family peptidase [Oscillospiraceae bacterium]|nr:C39 family peptidase [Oscillospiraceae bacterium]
MLKKISGLFICTALVVNSFISAPSEKVFAQVTVKSISASDVYKIKQSILGTVTLTADEVNKYDLNGDSKVNVVDLSAAKSIVVYNKKPAFMNLDVAMVMQNPELPTGCEVTTLTMLMNYNGFDVSKSKLADLMPKLNFYYYNGSLYGADFITTFPGNPYSSSGYGCYTPCMVTTSKKYFESIGSTSHYLSDITGTDFNALLDHVAMGRPVMVWATMSMIAPVLTTRWTTPEGKAVQWLGNEHCLLITGYDKTKGIVYVNDPLKGKVTYPVSTISLRYNQMGKYAAIMLKNGESPDTPSKPPISNGKHKVGDVVTYSGDVHYSSYGGSTVYVSGTFVITQIVEDETRPYRIMLGNQGWIPYDAV